MLSASHRIRQQHAKSDNSAPSCRFTPRTGDNSRRCWAPRFCWHGGKSCLPQQGRHPSKTLWTQQSPGGFDFAGFGPPRPERRGHNHGNPVLGSRRGRPQWPQFLNSTSSFGCANTTALKCRKNERPKIGNPSWFEKPTSVGRLLGSPTSCTRANDKRHRLVGLRCRLFGSRRPVLKSAIPISSAKSAGKITRSAPESRKA